MSDGTGGERRRDAARSRELLLRAAVELFAERGFDRTTIREIGERAGVDPALIARYFGGKTQLYLATVQAEHGDATPADLLDEERLAGLLDRFEQRGPGPGLQTVVLPSDDSAVQDAVRAHLHRRLVDPLRERLEREGVDRPQLRAELAVAAFTGVLLARSSAGMPHLAAADPAEVRTLLHDLLAAAAGRAPDTGTPS
ncbi:TetR/AcrR family transcriptional regulator [Kitasatospora sp. DSM 101779]|uniref:TetR/AcrR family transcriptional regulator n=1 Tax=Kitasatospora sp. DSM 101779 TaxID=2853165 RepID=UPI0021D9C633|nr:TetR/AcrR family transcriptional regulator [Kitasatospora sp. DSM 101779]MCU7827009.1 TetR family transcriptional regulator [Kitasatospora sp. DSM 101779]